MENGNMSQDKIIWLFQKGFNYSQDGPGNRLVLHMQGCNLKCPWCANPEGMAIGKGKEEYTVDKLFTYILKCSPMFFEGGGVTFTGGEPTLQWDGLSALMQMLKEADVNVAMETNGTCDRLEQLFPYIDHLIMDFKTPNEQKALEIMGCSTETIRQNIEKAVAAGKKPLIRIPFVNHFNTSEEDMEGFLAFFESLGKDNFRLECLTYHEYGKGKWIKCGKEYLVEDGFVPEVRFKEIKKCFKDHGITVVNT